MNVWNEKQIRMMSNILNNPFLFYLDSGSYFLVVPLGNSSSSISYFHFTQVEIKCLRFKRANSFPKRNSSFRLNKKSVRSLHQQNICIWWRIWIWRYFELCVWFDFIWRQWVLITALNMLNWTEILRVNVMALFNPCSIVHSFSYKNQTFCDNRIT